MEDHFFQFAVAISRLNKLVQKLKTKGMGHFDMKAAHTLCLYQLINAEEGMTFSQVAEGCDLDPALVSRVLQLLVARNMVYKDGAPGKYNARYRLTPEGEAVGRQLQIWVARVQRRADVDIAPGDLKVFYRVLHHLLANFEAMTRQPEAIFKINDTGETV